MGSSLPLPLREGVGGRGANETLSAENHPSHREHGASAKHDEPPSLIRTTPLRILQALVVQTIHIRIL
jgi:hypothetical protein